MNTFNEIIIYDPQGRNLDLDIEFKPFFRVEKNWKNCSMTGTYLKCARYLILKRMNEHGLKFVEDPIVDKSEIDTFELVLSSGMAIKNGYIFPESEMCFLREISGSVQMILDPDAIPPGQAFDSIRVQYQNIKNALEIFK